MEELLGFPVWDTPALILDLDQNIFRGCAGREQYLAV